MNRQVTARDPLDLGVAQAHLAQRVKLDTKELEGSLENLAHQELLAVVDFQGLLDLLAQREMRDWLEKQVKLDQLDQSATVEVQAFQDLQE